MIYIYTLSDSSTDEIRYVGKAKNPYKRFEQHLREAKANKYSSHKDNWIRILLSKNIEVKMEILDFIEDIDWKWLEIYWIAQLRNWGFKLTNMTDGGDGNNNQIFSEESNIKRSNALLGISRPEDVKSKISESHKGKKLSNITKEKLRQCNLGKTYSEESKLKKSKKVKMCLDDNCIIFDSVKACAEHLDCRKSSISNGILRRNGKYKEYKVEYI